MVAEHRSHLVKRSILVVECCLCLSLPNFAQEPLPRFASPILVVFAVLVRLFQEEDADGKAKNHESSADQVWKKKRVRLKDGVLEKRHYVGGTSEQAAKRSANDGATKSGQHGQFGTCSVISYPRHQTKGMME